MFVKIVALEPLELNTVASVLDGESLLINPMNGQFFMAMP